MRVFRTRKRSGGYRLIYAPSPDEKKYLRELNDELHKKDFGKYAYGFVRGRNIVLNAMQHIGKKVSVCFDLKDFFDTVTPQKLSKKIEKKYFEVCFPDGATRQGLPTSPTIANISMKEIDKVLAETLKSKDKTIVYTRYADDLTFSSDDDSEENIEFIKKKVKEIIGRAGFQINEKKTRVQYSKNGRREICGITVDDGVHTSRKFRRRLRAGRHNLLVLNNLVLKTIDDLQQANFEKYTAKQLHRRLHELKEKQKKQLQRVAGMEEFAKLRLPLTSEEKKQKILKRFGNIQDVQIEECKKIAEKYGLLPPLKVEKSFTETKYEEGVLITNDPCYMYGMSTYTTGWDSCMTIDTGGFHKGLPFWQRFKGVSVAVLLSSEKMSLAGVERNKIKARALVFKLRSGKKCFARVYGNKQDKLILAEVLKKHEFEYANSCIGEYVVGSMDVNIPEPYFDNVDCETVIIKETGTKAKRLKIVHHREEY